MFHVKHNNNKDNILHVHIGDRTHARTRRRTGRQAGAPVDKQPIQTSRQGQHINLLLYKLATI